METREILKAYLGNLSDKPGSEIRESLRAFTCHDKLLIETKAIYQVATYLLVKDGFQNYETVSSSQIVNYMMNPGEDISDYFRVSVLLLFVLSGEVENKRRWEFIQQFALNRSLMNVRKKGLVVICNYSIPSDVLAEFQLLQFAYLKINSFPCKERSVF